MEAERREPSRNLRRPFVAQAFRPADVAGSPEGLRYLQFCDALKGLSADGS